MKHIVFFLTAALLLNASCGSSDEGGKTDPPAAPVPVAPTTELGKADEAIENLQLKPGKLISINQVNAANCRRAVAAGMCIDIMASDNVVFASGMDDTKLEELTREVREHNQYAKRMPVLEEQMKVANHRIKDLEAFHKPKGGGDE